MGCANGGADLEMPNGKFMNRKNLRPAIQDGASVILRSTEKGAALCEPHSMVQGKVRTPTEKPWIINFSEATLVEAGG